MTSHICGDSIAAGLGHQMSGISCTARPGATPAEILPYVRAANFLIVSAGTNGPQGLVREGLDAIRAKAASLNCRFVIWILPIETYRRSQVQQVAALNGDDKVAFIAGDDGAHPANYKALASAVRDKMQSHSG